MNRVDGVARFSARFDLSGFVMDAVFLIYNICGIKKKDLTNISNALILHSNIKF